MGNTEAVIVALPPDLDPIRIVGDEEKHATLLYFGETSSLPEDAKTKILESLATVVTMFPPFSEERIGIERLGNDVPPALVAMLSNRCLGKIRNSFQINPAIVEYMANAQQHDAYVPHVTLAHPDYQGEAQLKQLVSSLYDVRFDRLALWWNDERFEFKLGFQDVGDRPKQLMMKMELDEFLTHMGITRNESSDPGNAVTRFLAHHGIKGMRWGIRRSDKTLGGAGGGAGQKSKADEDKSTKKAMDKMPPGSVVPMKTSDGQTKLLLKKKDGSWKETYVSADAERFIHSREKAGHELSDRDLKETLARARMVKDYDGMFGDKPNAELQAKVDAMKLQVDYKKYNEELHPPRPSIVQKFTNNAAKAYAAYQVADKISQGALSQKVGGNLADLINGTSAAPPVPKAPTPPKAPKVKKSGSSSAPWQTPKATFKPNPSYTPGKKSSSSTPLYDISDLGKGYTPPASDYPNPLAPALNPGKG